MVAVMIMQRAFGFTAGDGIEEEYDQCTVQSARHGGVCTESHGHYLKLYRDNQESVAMGVTGQSK